MEPNSLEVQRNSHTKATFQALADAVIPSTPELAARFGPEHAIGAVDLGVDEYVMWTFDHSISIQRGFKLQNVRLSTPIAKMLDVAANELYKSIAATQVTNAPNLQRRCTFSSLSRRQRLQAIALLADGKVDPGRLPSPFTNNTGLVDFTVMMLPILVMFGHYSEWPGYGTTRTLTPEKRKLKFFPPGWLQAKYPGTSLGYRDYRDPPFTMSDVKGGADHV